jgi:hypothetical protein
MHYSCIIRHPTFKETCVTVKWQTCADKYAEYNFDAIKLGEVTMHVFTLFQVTVMQRDSKVMK